MSNPTGPDHENEPAAPAPVAPDVSGSPDASTPPDDATEVFASPVAESPPPEPADRRYTAPGFDAGATQIIDEAPEPETEVFSTLGTPPPVPTPQPQPQPGSDTPPRADAVRSAAPQAIPPRTANTPGKGRSWGWVLALILVIAALAAVAILGTVLLTRNSEPEVSQEDLVRSTIQKFDIAIQNGDLAALRSITCGSTRDGYVNYDDRAWAVTQQRVAAAKEYPVVASIDQVVVNGDHAEANVTTFMAKAPDVRSTRSFDLQFSDEQWKICQSPT